HDPVRSRPNLRESTFSGSCDVRAYSSSGLLYLSLLPRSRWSTMAPEDGDTKLRQCWGMSSELLAIYAGRYPATKAAMEADGVEMASVRIEYLDEVGSGDN